MSVEWRVGLEGGIGGAHSFGLLRCVGGDALWARGSRELLENVKRRGIVQRGVAVA